MSIDPRPDKASLSVDVLERIDRICVEFESAWKADQPPRVEQYLGETGGAERSRLLRELLLLDLDYRGRRYERPTLEEYVGRFPQDRGPRADARESPPAHHLR